MAFTLRQPFDEFDVTAIGHDENCVVCYTQAIEAAVIARATGSVGATAQMSAPITDPGAPTVIAHSATVARVRCTASNRFAAGGDCCCQPCSTLRGNA